MGADHDLGVEFSHRNSLWAQVSMNLLRGEGPSFCQRSQLRPCLRPIVQHRWIEIRTVGPNQGVSLWVQPNLIEHGRILKGTVKLSLEHRAKVDYLKCAVLELQLQSKGPHLLEIDNAMDFVRHGPCLLQCFNLRR